MLFHAPISSLFIHCGNFFFLQKFVRQGYLSGGAGYVVSRAALKLIAEAMKKEISACEKRGGSEDVNLGESFF